MIGRLITCSSSILIRRLSLILCLLISLECVIEVLVQEKTIDFRLETRVLNDIDLLVYSLLLLVTHLFCLVCLLVCKSGLKKLLLLHISLQVLQIDIVW